MTFQARRRLNSDIEDAFSQMGAEARAHVEQALRQLGKTSLFDGPISRYIAETVNLSGFKELAQKVVDTLTAVATDAADILLSNFDNVSALAGEALDAASNWAKRRGAALVGLQYDVFGNLVPFAGAEYSIVPSSVNMIERLIASGMEEGLTPDMIAAGIEAQVFGSERAALIAAVEVQRANSYGLLEGASLLGTVGISAKKYWQTADDERVCVEICGVNELDGFIGINEEFTSGDVMTPGHPNCRCNLVIQA